MRLVYTDGDGVLRRTEDLIGDRIPPYAILSHTWQEEQEVTFDDFKTLGDIKDSKTSDKEGYNKIRFCAQQAKRDGLDYFWVDTCCIDKTNNTELSEAINSMFRWYQNAERCYVYLTDVETNTMDEDTELPRTWEPAFSKSRWFTRGWTLQELLAPRSVEFFSKEGARLGDRESLVHTIHERTGIPISALQGNQLSGFSIAERFSWTVNRQTMREEDEAYCLLGIFGIYISLIYGEGKDNAIRRLQKEVGESFGDAVGALVNDTKDRSRNREEWLGKICKWLAAPDPSTNYHKAHKQRQAKTGIWLLENAKFLGWKVNAASRLWLYGIPGCGKTILSSTIIEHLLQHCCNDPGMVTLYFYFDFNDTQKQSPGLMLHSLLGQLSQRSVAIHRGLDTLFSSCENGHRQPSEHALLEVMRQIMQEFTHVYIVLDALDECTQRQELMDVLKTIGGWQLENLHLLMTSRKERDIESSLESYVDEEDTVCLQSDVVDEDIQRYVQHRLSDDKSLIKWEKDAVIREEIETVLMRGACGMFRWAACQLDTLGKCRNRVMLRRSLTTLPPTLDQTYDRILSAISKEDEEYAMRILQWLTFSARPLSVEEVAEVVAIDVGRDPAFDRDEVLEDPLEVLNICSSLVTITTHQEEASSKPIRQIVALAHYSVQEYLVSDRIKQGQAKQYSMQEADCHNIIARGSLKYLMQFQEPLTKEILETYVLARYSAEFWSSHTQKAAHMREEISQLAMTLFCMENPAYLAWIQLCDPESPWSEPDLQRIQGSIATPLYYAARLGLNTITKLLLDRGADINAQSGTCDTALQAASVGGYEQVVKTLLNKGAEVNIQGGYYRNALQAASLRGHEQIAKMLLNKGAEINAQGGVYDSALQAASFEGREQVVEILLNEGAEVNAQGGEYGNALQAASAGGYEQIVKILLNKGAEVNAQGGRYGNALQAASVQRYEQMVKMLLDQGAEVDARGGKYSDALEAAVVGGCEQVVKILLDNCAAVNTQRGFYGSALQTASQDGKKQLVELLLSNGADVNTQVGYYNNALQAASWGGHEQIVKMLLDKGAHVNVQGGEYGNALQAASVRGHEPIVKILLNEGAEVNAQCGGYSTALQAASLGGHEQIVKILLNQGAEVNTQGGMYSNALYAASSQGHEQTVKILLSKGAEVNMQGGYYGNALQAASVLGHEQIVKMLLDQGANVNEQGGQCGTALWAAFCRGDEKLVEILLDNGADANTQGGVNNDNVLQIASRGGYEQIVKMLLEKGADVNAQSGSGESALYGASWIGHEQIVGMLLDKGADVNAKGENGNGALLAASWMGHVHIVEMLLDKGADTNSHSALQRASRLGHKQIVKMLLDKGVDANAQAGSDGSALYEASLRGHEQIVKMLLDKGAEVNTQGGHHGSPLQVASWRGHKQIVEMLLNKGAKFNT